MTDAMFRQVLSQLSAELREHREYMQSLAHDVSNVAGTCMRIEAQVAALGARLEDLRDDHDKVCADWSRANKSLDQRIAHIERQAAWVRAWSAGAVAVVVAVFGAIAWVAVRLPEVVSIVGDK